MQAKTVPKPFSYDSKANLKKTRKCLCYRRFRLKLWKWLCHGGQYFSWNLRLTYYIDGIVFLADNIDLADNTQFLLVTWCFRNHIWNLKNMWVAHRARGAERKSERGAKRPTEAGADPLARGATHMWFFKFQIRFGKNIMLIRKKMLLSKIYISQPKQQCYTCESIVYGPFITLFTLLLIFIFWSWISRSVS